MPKYYSQNDEERYILEYFGDVKGRFLDIGANDGKTLSNTYRLALNHWDGVYVEPDARARTLLWDNIADLPGSFEIKTFALGPRKGTVKFFQGGDGHSTFHDSKGLLSTTRESELQRWGSTETFEETEVQMLTFAASGIEELGPFDFISIDAEGQDWNILKQMNLKVLGCKMLCIEYNGSEKMREEISWHCLNHGLTFVMRNFENIIYSV